MAAPATTEGTRAVLHYARVSPYKVREVLDLIRGQHVEKAADTLRLCERDAALLVGKVLHSAVANATHNDGLDGEELYVSACYADEGPTLKRFRFRARGRTTRIRKRTSHITVIVSRLPEAELRRFRTKQAAEQAARRSRRVAGGRRAEEQTAPDRGGRFRRRRARGQGQEAAPGVEEVTAAVAAAMAAEEPMPTEAAPTEAESTEAEAEATESAEATRAVATEAADAAVEESAEAGEAGEAGRAGTSTEPEEGK